MTGIILVFILSYLLGSLPNAVWLVRLFAGIDIRTQGSGNPGATNVLRTMGWRLALPVFVADVLKGVVAIWICMIVAPFGYAYTVAGVLAVLGHQYPVFSGFRGGRGVSTAAGVLLILDWRVLSAALLVFLLVMWRYRIVSVSSMMAAGTALGAAVVILLWVGVSYLPVFLALLIIVALLFVGHRDNIRRLRQGREHPIEI